VPPSNVVFIFISNGKVILDGVDEEVSVVLVKLEQRLELLDPPKKFAGGPKPFSKNSFFRRSQKSFDEIERKKARKDQIL